MNQNEASYPSDDFWTRILGFCQHLDSGSTGSEEDRILLKEKLDTILETYDRVFDPIDNYSEYVFILFCKSVMKSLHVSSNQEK